jgi:hypothetical protein
MADFDIAAFRVKFPAFADEVIYPDATIQSAADDALCFFTEHACACSDLLWQLITAHLLQLRTAAAAGGGGTGMVTSASIDKVSVSITAPPAADGYTYWLTMSPYGLQAMALLSGCGAGGLYVGGRPERSAFRSVGGGFPNRGRFWR